MGDPPAHKLAAQQARFNRSTRDHWGHFASHRERIEQLLVGDGLAASGRLCVLGAGNCNDLDLGRLAGTFDEVHLVDLDAAALQAAVGRQGVATSANVFRHAPVDLSAVANTMATWPGRSPGGAEIDGVVARVREAPLPRLGGPFDVVLSPCVLSQIVGYANDTLGPDHPRLHAVRRALRDRHLRLLADQVAPGGWGVLVTDAASDQAVGDLERLAGPDGDRLPDLLRTLAARGKTFPGLDPTSVEAALRSDPLLACQLQGFTVQRPWVWRLGPLKSFLVYALRFRRSRGTILL